MSKVVYDGIYPAVNVAGHYCEKGKIVDLPTELADELVAREEFKAAEKKPAASNPKAKAPATAGDDL